jgi:hypothetical protein
MATTDYEVRMFGCERAALLGPSRGRAPGEYMRGQLRKTVIRECTLQLELCERMKGLRDAGLSQTTEYRQLRLDLEWSRWRCDGAQAAEVRAFGPQETR